MGGSYRVAGRAIDTSLGELHELLDQVRAEQTELDALELAMLETAVIEVAGNVIEHGTPPGGIEYEFLLEVSGNGLHGLLYDNGDQVSLPDTNGAEQDELAESGRGLLLARAALTELRYERQGDRNAWFMTRLRSSS